MHKAKITVSSIVGITQPLAEIEAITAEMAFTPALTSETVGAFEAGTTIEMVSLPAKNSVVMVKPWLENI